MTRKSHAKAAARWCGGPFAWQNDEVDLRDKAIHLTFALQKLLPNLFGNLDDMTELRPLLILCKQIAFLCRCKAALWTEIQLG